MISCRSRGGGLRRRAVAVSVASVVSALAVACSSTPPAVSAPKVSRGTVANRVTAAGALTAVTSQNLGFPKGAQLTEVNVKVGDRVQQGQVLAKVDDFAFRQDLAQKQAALNQQQAQLDKIVNGTAVTGAKATLDQAEHILAATRKNVDAQKAADSEATRRARVQLSFDEEQLDKAQEALDAHGCPPDPLGGTASSSSGRRTSTGGTGAAPGSRTDPASGLGTASDTGTADSTCASDAGNVTAAQRQVISSRTAYTSAKSKEDVDAATGQVSIENAKQSVVSARNDVNSSGTDRPSEIAAQRAVVESARAAVALSQRDVDNAVLRAPVPGTVSAINGAVGEFVGSASSGTTALAPGTDASIPSVGAAATSDQAGNSGNGPSATRPGGGAFIVLNNLNTFQVVVPFEESDAAKITPNQRVDVTFDAVPDLTRHGTVLSVAPAGTAISGVTNYYATVVLTDTDPRLRSGQTAQAAVLVNALDNVLMVPNSAVIRQGGATLVNTPGPDGKPVPLRFQPGMVGDDTTQVLSGLHEGQPILTPQGRAGR